MFNFFEIIEILILSIALKELIKNLKEFLGHITYLPFEILTLLKITFYTKTNINLMLKTRKQNLNFIDIKEHSMKSNKDIKTQQKT